jgi:23S rRNA (uracil1939-C5)-methyltransferase
MTRVSIEGFEQKANCITPFCKHFDDCGGCSFQHWNEIEYRAWKRGKISAALGRQSIDASIADVIDAHGEGRRRVVLHVREIEGTWCAGFMAAKSHTLVALDSCPVLEPKMQNAPAIAAAFGPSLGACDVALTLTDQGLDVAIKAERSAGTKRLPHLQEQFRKLKLCRLSVNGETVLAEGAPTITIGKSQVPLAAQAFLQATKLGEDTLASLVLSVLKKSKVIVDLFCGVGPFALHLAEKSRVYAVDMDTKAVDSLAAAVRTAQGLKPVSYAVRDLFLNPLVPQELNEFDGVVLDPPRAGAEAQTRSLAKSRVKRIAYVSCDPHTFAHDAKILIAAGYKLKLVTPVDQFKWTAHIELVGEFVR